MTLLGSLHRPFFERISRFTIKRILKGREVVNRTVMHDVVEGNVCGEKSFMINFL